MKGEPLSVSISAGEIPRGGRHVRIEADAEARLRLARQLGIPGVEALSAELDLRPAHGRAITVRGRVEATVVQADVVTLEPVTQTVAEDIDLMLVPAEDAAPPPKEKEFSAETDEPDFYRNGRIELGSIVAEHVALGLDPYPRAPDVQFADHVEHDSPEQASPFAGLAALRKRGE
jgi:uncharacterized protein